MKQEQGFSLIEVIVVMGIASIAAYILMHTSQMKSKERRTERANQELETYFNNIKGLLTRSPYCVASLSSLKIKQGSLKDVYPFSSIKTPTKFPKYEIGQTLEGLVVLSKLSLSEVILADENMNNYLGRILVGFKKKGKVYGGKSLTKSIDIEFALNEEGEVIACESLSQEAGPDANLDDLPDIDDMMKMQGKGAPSKKEIEEALENNPFIKQLHEQSQQIQEANERMEKLLNE